MRALTLCFAMTLAATAAAAAPFATHAPRPYTAVAITRPAASADESLAAFRKQLAAVARKRLYSELAPLVRPQGFFWGRDYAASFDPHRPAVDNLAAAISLEHANGLGWRRLAAFAADATAEPLDSHPGVICTPAPPRYDEVAFARLLDSSYTGPIDWSYPRTDAIEVRATPNVNGAIVATLGPAFVRLMGFEGPESEALPGLTQWARIALPDGKTGYVAPGSLLPLAAPRLCYGKDQTGAWRITGFIAGDL